MQFTPSAVYRYFDKVNLRLRNPLSRQQMLFLQANCRSRRKHHAVQMQGQYISGYPWLVSLVCPNRIALEFLAELPDAIVNWVEPALDFILPEHDSPLEMAHFFERHFVQRWNRKRSPRTFPNGGTITGQSAQGHFFAWYPDLASKVTGEINCFHLEGRIKGVQAVHRIGIQHPADLLTLDHDAYWRRHLTLYKLDIGRLGQWHLNRHWGVRRHRAEYVGRSSYRYHVDRLTGSKLFRAHGYSPTGQLSLQNFIANYGHGIRPYLRRIRLHLLLTSETAIDPDISLPKQ